MLSKGAMKERKRRKKKETTGEYSEENENKSASISNNEKLNSEISDRIIQLSQLFRYTALERAQKERTNRKKEREERTSYYRKKGHLS